MSILLFACLMGTCCSYALIRGAAPERIAAGLQIAAFALTLLLHGLFDVAGFTSTAFGTAIVDAALFMALSVLAWRSTRFWPLWIAGWQLAAIVGHLARVLDPAMLPLGYAIQATFWSYPMLIATAIGARRHRMRVAGGDPDPAWKNMPA